MKSNNLIKAVRVLKGMRQRDLAQLVGVDNVHICRIETGEFGLSPRMAERIGKVLGLSAESLRRNDGKK